jgi:hypothetical protein
VLEKQGEYILYAEANPPGLHADPAAAFATAEGGDFSPPGVGRSGTGTPRRPRRGPRAAGGSRPGRWRPRPGSMRTAPTGRGCPRCSG